MFLFINRFVLKILEILAKLILNIVIKMIRCCVLYWIRIFIEVILVYMPILSFYISIILFFIFFSFLALFYYSITLLLFFWYLCILLHCFYWVIQKLIGWKFAFFLIILVSAKVLLLYIHLLMIIVSIWFHLTSDIFLR